MKKVLIFIIALCFIFVLVGCNNKDDNKTIDVTSVTITGENETVTEAHLRYANNYKPREFPKNLYISSIYREEKKKKLLHQ